MNISHVECGLCSRTLCLRDSIVDVKLITRVGVVNLRIMDLNNSKWILIAHLQLTVEELASEITNDNRLVVLCSKIKSH